MEILSKEGRKKEISVVLADGDTFLYYPGEAEIFKVFGWRIELVELKIRLSEELQYSSTMVPLISGNESFADETCGDFFIGTLEQCQKHRGKDKRPRRKSGYHLRYAGKRKETLRRHPNRGGVSE